MIKTYTYLFQYLYLAVFSRLMFLVLKYRNFDQVNFNKSFKKKVDIKNTGLITL